MASAGHPYVVFDLDDTLCPEEDFVLSGFHAVSRHWPEDQQPKIFECLESTWRSKRDDAFAAALNQFPKASLAKAELLETYRSHEPDLALAPDIAALLDQLDKLEIPLGLVTDGRSLTQRHKLRALGIEDRFRKIVISAEIGSEKPDPANFQGFAQDHGEATFFYIGDNPRKDFIAPNALGWTTVCVLDDGRNIHPQDFSGPEENQPQHQVDALSKATLLPLLGFNGET